MLGYTFSICLGLGKMPVWIWCTIRRRSPAWTSKIPWRTGAEEYQTNNFKSALDELLELDDQNKTLALPVTWDPAHLMNLAVTDVRDAKTKSGKFFKLFIKRSNIFNQLLSHGKGFAFLNIIDEKARRPVNYAAQRFTSSAMEQWKKIFQSYGSYIEAFETLHPNRDSDEEWQYMIMGSDYISDLLWMIDVMKPLSQLMLLMQSLDCPVWKFKKLFPVLKSNLELAGFDYKLK